VYNGEEYLREAIDSVLNQSFKDFELLIINDGSTDDSQEIINSYEDDRIICYRQENSGIVVSLNRVLVAAQGEYLIRMDADDICLPERFARQVEFMDAHPDVGICGSWIYIIDVQGRVGGIKRYPVDDELIRAEMFFESPFAHPSVILRRVVLKNNNLQYDGPPYAEDYRLWAKLLSLTKFANLPEPLLKYRQGVGSGSNSLKIETQIASKDVQRELIGKYFFIPSRQEIDLHFLIYDLSRPLISAEAKKIIDWLKRLKRVNKRKKIIKVKLFNLVIAGQWFVYIGKYKQVKPLVHFKIILFSLVSFFQLSLKNKKQLFNKTVKLILGRKKIYD